MTVGVPRSQAFGLTRLTLTDFRNYAGLRLEPPPGLIALAGANGAGKTNLLEAVSLLMPGRGLRGADFATLSRQDGKGGWAVSAHVQGPGGERQLGTAWNNSEADAGAAARAVLVDGHLQKGSGALAGHLRVVWLTPAMDRLFAGPAGDRRRYLDRMVSLFDVEHGTRVAVFEKLMRERNALLQAPVSDRSLDSAWAASLETQMAEVAVAIAAARRHAVEVLGSALTRDQLDGPFPWSRLTIEGETESLVQELPAVAAEEAYRRKLQDTRALDRAAGRTLSGPHRSDLVVHHGPKGMPAAEGSTGEQKALLIGLVLAQANAIRSIAGGVPVLLLDEIAAHLDRPRRTALFGLLEQLGAQVWMTGTEPHLFDGAGPSTVVYQVENGQLRESKTG